MTVVEDYQAATEQLAASTQAEVRAIYLRLVSGEITREDAVLLTAAAINRANASSVTLADVYLAAQIEAATGLPTPATGVLPVDSSERLIKAVRTILFDPATPAAQMTKEQISQRITDVGLDPKDWKIAAIARSVNESIREADELREEPHPIYTGEDFIELVNENPGHDDAPVLNSDDYTHVPDLWEAEAEGGSIGRLERLARAEPLDSAQRFSMDAIKKQRHVEGWTRQMDADPCQLCKWWWREGRIWPKEHPFQRHKGCNCQPKIVVAEHIQSTGFTRKLERNRAS